MISAWTKGTDIRFLEMTERLGPTWDWDEQSRQFVLPEYSLGPVIILWMMTYLRSPQDPSKHFELTPEQARFICWMYAVDENGEWLYPKEIYLQRSKGWGKDPLGAAILLAELCGPVRFSHWGQDSNGTRIAMGKKVVNPLVQMMAVKHDQNKNTTLNFPVIISQRLIKEYRMTVNNESVTLKDGGRIEIASSQNGGSIQGNGPTFIMFNEIQHYTDASSHNSFEIAQGNASKRYGRTLAIFNAPNPNENSIANLKREAYIEMKAGRAYDVNYLYDSLEGSSKQPLETAEQIMNMLKCVYGDSWFANLKGFSTDIMNISTPLSYSKRYYLNMATISDETWVDIRDWDEGAQPGLRVGKNQEIVMFFDGSKSEDDTGLVGCRVSDGYVFKIGHWHKPEKQRGDTDSEKWVAPREDVLERIHWAFKNYNVVAFWADPSHAKTDSGLDGSGGQVEFYWDNMLDTVHRQYKDKLKLWANQAKHQSVIWDMSNPSNHSEFVDGLLKVEDEIYNRQIIHDGNADIRRHISNAKRAELRDGRHSIWKGEKNGPKKIDLAVCVIGALMLRGKYLNKSKGKKNQAFSNLY